MSQKLTKFHNETYGKVFYMSQITRVRDIITCARVYRYIVNDIMLYLKALQIQCNNPVGVFDSFCEKEYLRTP